MKAAGGRGRTYGGARVSVRGREGEGGTGRLCPLGRLGRWADGVANGPEWGGGEKEEEKLARGENGPRWG
jgi:hypothetical protein